jgi:hypothetical protein
MTAGDVLNKLKAGVDGLVDSELASPTMYDQEHLDAKVSAYVFQNNEKGHLTRKFKITVEDISITQEKKTL